MGGTQAGGVHAALSAAPVESGRGNPGGSEAVFFSMQQLNWKVAPAPSPQPWSCNIVRGGNRPALESFKLPGLEGCLLSVPCADSEAGGDIYHITVCDHGVFSKFLLIDVAGHGDAAADLSSRLQQPLHRLMSELDNGAILQVLNRKMLDTEANGNFATATAATYNHWDRSWTYAYAGHPFMLMRATDGHWYHLPECCAGPPVGVVGDAGYYQNEIRLQGDEWILLFSDAVLEIQRPDGSRLGFDGLIGLLQPIHETAIGEFYQALVRALVEVNGGDHFDDDLTLILLRHAPRADKALDRLLQGGQRLMMRWMKRNEKRCRTRPESAHPPR